MILIFWNQFGNDVFFVRIRAKVAVRAGDLAARRIVQAREFVITCASWSSESLDMDLALLWASAKQDEEIEYDKDHLDEN